MCIFHVFTKITILFPNFLLVNEESVRVFTTIDVNTVWGERPRPAGYYTATAWIPGNLLADGTYYVRATMRTPDRNYRPFNEGDVIAFNVIDSMEGGTARGSWVGVMTGVVRPKLEWNTDYTADTGGPIHKVVSG